MRPAQHNSTQFALYNAANSACLDITSHGTGDNADVEVYSCNYGDNQEWAQDGAPMQQAAASGAIVSAMDSACLTACPKLQ